MDSVPAGARQHATPVRHHGARLGLRHRVLARSREARALGGGGRYEPNLRGQRRRLGARARVHRTAGESSGVRAGRQDGLRGRRHQPGSACTSTARPIFAGGVQRLGARVLRHAQWALRGVHRGGGQRAPISVSTDVRGGNITRITQNQGANSYPACSPDGRLLAFFSTRKSDKGPGLYVVPLAACGARGAFRPNSANRCGWDALPSAGF